MQRAAYMFIVGSIVWSSGGPQQGEIANRHILSPHGEAVVAIRLDDHILPLVAAEISPLFAA